MTKSQLEHLIDRYLQGNAMKEEVDMVENFYTHLLEDRELIENLNDHDKNQIKKRMYHNIHGRIHKNQKKKVRHILSAVAAVVLLLVSGYLYITEFSKEAPSTLFSATMITAEAGSGQRSILLNDGTYVLLNPGSSLSYPDTFYDHVRKVHLVGEAWFDVKRDTLHPFQVVSNGITTVVLGTSFSINALSDNSSVEIKVTSGRVQVNSQEKELAILEKDDQLVYHSGKVEVSRKGERNDKKTDHLPKPGAFKLANVTMEEAAMFLEKRWNRKITFENHSIRDCPLYASFNANDSLEEVLMILCGVTNSHFKIENEKIKIYGKGCY